LWALALVGFDATLGPANSPEALMGLKMVYVFLPAIIFVSAGIIIWKYPLNKERQERIRAAIDRRQERRTQAAVQLAE
jgi:Na+/melibiose symporter-like transporter